MSQSRRSNLSLFFGGEYPEACLASIVSGRHPRVEYQEFLSGYGGVLVTFDDVQTSASPLVQRVARRAGSLWGLAVLAASGRSGAILTTGEDVGLPLALVQWLTSRRRPVYIVLHGSYLGSGKGAAALSLLRHARHVSFLCLSESLRKRLVERHRMPAQRVFTVGYGVDTEFFRPRPQENSAERLIVSAGTANRDYRTLVAAATGMDAQVKIAADSAWFRADTDIAGQPLPPHVEARSYGNYQGLRLLYAQASAVVVPLYPAVHACGYAVIAEAMAMGKPVIATRTETPSDFVIEGETGFLVPPGDVVALRDRLQFLLDHPDEANRLGRNARQMIEERYTLEAYNARVAAVMGVAPIWEEQADEPRLASV